MTQGLVGKLKSSHNVLHYLLPIYSQQCKFFSKFNDLKSYPKRLFINVKKKKIKMNNQKIYYFKTAQILFYKPMTATGRCFRKP